MPSTFDISVLSGLPRIGAALVLVLLAAGISRWQGVDLEKHMVIAVLRAFVQLIAIGYALNLVFDSRNPVFIVLILVVMITVAGFTSGQRGKGIPHAQAVALISIAVGALLTLGLLVALGVFRFTSRDIIPIGGMVIGNSMNTCSLIMARLRDEIKTQKGLIETALALGATPRQAIAPHLRRALHAGMTPQIDSTKTIGLVQLPGAMTGMILAGASPLQAVQLQIIVMYMLIGAAAYTGLAAAYLTYLQFFTAHGQLVEVTQP
jgi:putative ABC transport system permease protein